MLEKNTIQALAALKVSITGLRMRGSAATRYAYPQSSSIREKIDKFYFESIVGS
jgi:hypothetical protein